jgi:hypothetical protein
MSNNIEDFIKHNKSAFDTEVPGDHVWLKMEQELKKTEQKLRKTEQKQPASWWWVGIAASLLVVLGIGYMYNQKMQPSNALAQVSPQQAKKQVHFSSLIEKKTDSLQVFAAENPELYEKFTTDLDRIQADYDLLKQELVKSPNQVFVVRAMEKNLELQLQVVSQQLQIINQVRQVNKDSQL